MDVPELCEKLQAFGLEAGEARLYFHLSRIGPCRASDLAEQAGVHRTDVYRMAESLARKGFIEKTLERPVRFVPQPVQEVLENLAEEEAQRVKEMRERAEQLSQAWPNQATSWGSGHQRFAVHQGRSHIQALFQRMIDHAKEEIVFVMSRRGIASLGVGATLSQLDRKARQGVSVRILTRIDAANVAELRQIATTCEVRHVDLSAYHQMLLVDHKEIALFVANGSTKGTASATDETVMWLNSQDFVLAQKMLIDRAWKHGVDHDAMSWSLSHQTVAPSIETVRGEMLVLSTVKQMLSRSQNASLLLPADAHEAWWAQGLGRVIAARRNNGAEIRIAVHGTGAADDADVVSTGPPFPIVITEDEALMGRRTPDGDTWALQASLPDVVQWIRAQVDGIVEAPLARTS